MRKYLASLAFALALTAAAPVSAGSAATGETAAPAPAPVAVQNARVAIPGLRDEAAMVLVGTALIGLGAALRRSA